MQRTLGYLVLLVGICLLKICTCRHGQHIPPYWSLRRASKVGAVLQTVETRNMYQCQRLCWVTSQCVSVSFSTSSRVCTLYTDIPGYSDVILSRNDIMSSATESMDHKWISTCRHYTCTNGSACVYSKGQHLCLYVDLTSCGQPTNLANAVVAYTTTSVGSIATYTCDVGYAFQGSSYQTICGSDSQWSGLSGSCSVVICSVPSSISNAVVTYSTLTYNSSATYTCNVGYNFQGASSVSVCDADGQWSGLNGVCQIVTCNVPSSLSNADVTYPAMTFSSTATYTCHPGYNFQGSSNTAQCGLGGTWSGFSGNCQIVSCTAPLGLSNGIVTYSALTYGSTASYTCNAGYNFLGSSDQTTCGAGGTWIGLSGSCLIVTCPVPTAVTYASVTYTALTYGSTATYTCNVGNVFTGTNNDAVCGPSGVWTGFSGSCQIVSCTAPADIPAGSVTVTTLTYGSIATYICDAGYNFQGSSNLAVCGTNGQWSGLSGSCQLPVATCSVPAGVPNADVVYTSLTAGSSATYTCHNGYTFQGSSNSAVCVNSGVWSGLSGSCQIVMCPVPTTRPNSDLTYTALTFNSVATYSCHVGYDFQGSNKNSVCDSDGQWSGYSGSCQIVSCPVPADLSNADTSYTTLTYNSVVTYTCHVGYGFQGSSDNAVCGSNGQWSGQSGNCQIVTCGDPVAKTQGTVSFSSTTYNSVATHTCDPTYHFQNVGQVLDSTCQANGQWSSTPDCTNIQDCSDILAANSAATDGVYTIRPTVGSSTVEVYCDMSHNGGGWTVIQRRQDGSVDFHRTWNDYKNGFGSLTGEFWLGNKAIRRITNQKTYTLRFDLGDHYNNWAYAEYSQFYIETESSKYRLRVSGYSGNAGDSFAGYHNGMYFSASDRDNDQSSNHCANIMPGGWWYKKCLYSNMNGQYNVNSYSKGVNWRTWTGYYVSLKYTTMKLRPT